MNTQQVNFPEEREQFESALAINELPYQKLRQYVNERTLSDRDRKGAEYLYRKLFYLFIVTGGTEVLARLLSKLFSGYAQKNDEERSLEIDAYHFGVISEILNEVSESMPADAKFLATIRTDSF